MALSIWEQRSFRNQPDVAVIGAGIVGLFTAIHVKRAQPTAQVLVVERGAFPCGATVRNAGFACFGSPSELLADLRNEGLDAMLARVEERWKGLLALRAELGDAGIGFAPVGGYEVYRHLDPLYPAVAEGFELLNGAVGRICGTAPFHWRNDLIGAFGLHAASLVHNPLEGSVDSGALMRSLLAKAQSMGVLVRTGFEVRALEETASHVELIGTDETIMSRHAVAATNGYTPALLPHLDVVPARGQVLLTAPVPGLRLRGTFHMDEGFYYFRELEGRILLGGARNADLEGERTMAEGTTDAVQDALERALHEVIAPGAALRVEHRWSATMAFGARSKAPLVERLSPRTTCAVRLGGMGVAIGIRVAEQAARLVSEAME